MIDNNSKRKDAFDVMFELSENNPNITLDEIAEHLVENGYANSIASVNRFFVSFGLKES